VRRLRFTRPPLGRALVGGAALVLAAFPGSLRGQGPYVSTQQMLALPPLPFDTLVSYGPTARNFGELRLPDREGPHPVAVLIHGGCWLSIADNDYMDRLAAAITDAGWATWNLEFRTIDQPGGAWPGIFQDVAAGTDFLETIANEFDLDLRRVVTVGHSSGGQLALWLAARGEIDERAELYSNEPLRIRGAVSLAGIADIDGFFAMTDRACGDTPVRLLGGLPLDSVPERLAQVSPVELLPTRTPQLLISGQDDRTVPPSHVQAYFAAARGKKQNVQYSSIPDAGHFEVVAPWTRSWDDVWAVLGPFLETFGRGQRADYVSPLKAAPAELAPPPGRTRRRGG